LEAAIGLRPMNKAFADLNTPLSTERYWHYSLIFAVGEDIA